MEHNALAIPEAVAKLEEDSPRQYAQGTFTPEFDGLKVTLAPSMELMMGYRTGHDVVITASKRGQGERSVTVPLAPLPQGYGGDDVNYTPKQVHAMVVQLSCALNELLGMWAARLADSRTPGQRSIAPAPKQITSKDIE